MAGKSRIVSALAAEVAFAVLPLVVILMIAVHTNHVRGWFSSAEWAFAAAILFGQALVKFVVGLATGGRASAGPVALAVALIVVFGIVPSLTLLTLVLLAAPGGGQIAAWLQFAQVAAFVIAVCSYVVFGTIGELWKERIS